VITPLMTWVVLPLLIRLLKTWLTARRTPRYQ